MPIIPADATPEQIRRMAEEAQQESRNLRSQQDRMTAALEAATQAAASATAALQALSAGNIAQRPPASAAPKRKRPELPAFDKTNIHIWIQRVESAYAREDVTDPKQKFAFLESIIGVNLGPTINNFMFGEATADNWSAFLNHLKDTYGPTKEARCSVYLDGIKRNGLRPSDHLALIRDRAKEVTIDDLQKQLILRELPADVRKLVQDKVASLDAAATATLADKHFGKDGQPPNANSLINSVTQPASGQDRLLAVSGGPPPTPWPEAQRAAHQPTNDNANINNQLQEDAQAEINVVQGRRNRAPQRSSNSSRGANQSRYTPAFGSGTSQSRNQSAPRPNATTSQTNGHNAPPSTSSQERQYSNCKLHAADPASQLCNGPLCPLHSRATLCYSRRCNAHGQSGNGRGGRR